MVEKVVEHPTVFDSEHQQLGGVYAKALLGHGKQIGKLDQLVDELCEVVSVIQQVPGLSAVLDSPQVPAEAKEAIVDKAFNGKVDPAIVNFLKVVNRKSRFDCLPAVAQSARDLQDEMAGRVQALLTSAAEIDEATKQQVVDQLSKMLGKVVSLKVHVDPSLIGGMTVRVGDSVYDASLANQLSRLRGRVVEKTAEAIREKLERFVSN